MKTRIDDAVDWISLDSVPRIDRELIQIEYVASRFDGPISGIALYRGSRAWFQFHSMDEPGVVFSYILFRLQEAAAQILAEQLRAQNYSPDMTIELMRDDIIGRFQIPD